MAETRERRHLQRVPPHDDATEANVLGIALFAPDGARVVATVEPGIFYRPSHGHIAAAVRQLVTEDVPVDPGTVAALLRQQGLLDGIGGPDYLIQLQAKGGASTSAPHLLELIAGYARKRRMLAAAAEIVEAVYSGVSVEGLVAELGTASLDDEVARVSTWDQVNLAAVLAGDGEVPEPVCLTRMDGVALLYPGKVHTLNAEPEAGKSWIGQGACAQEIMAGHHAVYVDFEDDAAAVVGRMLELGCQPAEIIEFFHYVRPDEALDASARIRIGALCDAYHPTVAVVDGVTEALSLNGWKSNVDVDVAGFFAALPRPLARSGAAVLLLDHVTKDKETRGRWGIGSQHKLAGVDGATYGLDAVKPFSRGNSGLGRLWIYKDRHGKVRPHAAGQKLIAEVHFVSLEEGGVVSVELRPPTAQSGDGAFRPTGYMERVSRVLELSGGVAMSTNDVEAAVRGKAKMIGAALLALVSEGFADVDPGARGARMYRSTRPFREADEVVESGEVHGEESIESAQDEPF